MITNIQASLSHKDTIFRLFMGEILTHYSLKIENNPEEPYFKVLLGDTCILQITVLTYKSVKNVHYTNVVLYAPLDNIGAGTTVCEKYHLNFSDTVRDSLVFKEFVRIYNEYRSNELEKDKPPQTTGFTYTNCVVCGKESMKENDVLSKQDTPLIEHSVTCKKHRQDVEDDKVLLVVTTDFSDPANHKTGQVAAIDVEAFMEFFELKDCPENAIHYIDVKTYEKLPKHIDMTK